MADKKKTYGLPVIHKKAQKKCCLNCDHGTETYHYVICDFFESKGESCQCDVYNMRKLEEEQEINI